MATTDWNTVFELAVALAHEAGAELQRRFGQHRTITLKGDLDPVTDADHAAETIIRQGVAAHFPTHTILGEEHGAHGTDGPAHWIVDPLDGTVNYAHNFPHFAVSIAVADTAGVRLGVVYDPLRHELFTAQRGQPTRLDGTPVQVSTTTELPRALLATGFPYDRHLKEDNNHREYEAFSVASQGVRRAGVASLDLVYVACGRLDGYWEQGLSPWDVAAGALIVAQAGGCISTYAGEPYDGVGHQIVASNGHLHDAMLGKLGGVRQTLTKPE